MTTMTWPEKTEFAVITRIQNPDWATAFDHMERMITEGLASPYVRELASRFVFEPDPVYSIFQFVRARYPYTNDPDRKELFYGPHRLAQEYLDLGVSHGADCDDHAMYTACLVAVGAARPVRVEITDYEDYPNLWHAFAETFSQAQNRWIAVDTSSGLPLGWYVPYRNKIMEFVIEE